MDINWTILTPVIVATIAALVTLSVERIFERKARLISYFGHTSSFQLRQAPQTVINLHSVVIRNAGRKPATDIRLAHYTLPDNFDIFPQTQHSVAGTEIVIPRLVPGEQVTVSYLYYPPLTYTQINAGIKHSEGFAKGMYVLPTPQPGKSVVRLATVLMLAGTIAIIYGLIELGGAIYVLLQNLP